MGLETKAPPPFRASPGQVLVAEVEAATRLILFAATGRRAWLGEQEKEETDSSIFQKLHLVHWSQLSSVKGLSTFCPLISVLSGFNSKGR